jgi:hypothetical protein
LLGVVSDLRAKVEAHYGPVVDAAHKAHKAACAARKEHLDPLDEAEAHLRKVLARYLDGQAKALATARAAEEAAQSAAAVAATPEAQATAIAQLGAAAAAVVAREDALPSGLSLRKVKKLVILDAAAIPREWLVPDEKRILAALKAGLPVPGCELREEPTVAKARGGGKTTGMGAVIYEDKDAVVA